MNARPSGTPEDESSGVLLFYPERDGESGGGGCDKMLRRKQAAGEETERIMSRKLAKHWINAEEYERMGAAGIFPPDARLELIEGDIFEMSPIGSPHAACVTYLTQVFHELGRGFQVRVQNPVRLNDFSEPQPDIMLARWRADFYRGAHPTPADVLLVVEVADTTVVTDRTVKVPLYAAAGVAEVWLVNIPEERVEIYSDPAEGAYRLASQHARGETAHSPTLAGLGVSVDELFGQTSDEPGA
jgi:Uma2 family endonuclease